MSEFHSSAERIYIFVAFSENIKFHIIRNLITNINIRFTDNLVSQNRITIELSTYNAVDSVPTSE